MNGRALASFVVLQAGWFACALGAANGVGWVGPAVVLAALVVHVGRGPSSARGREVVFLAAAALVGFVVDTALLRLGVLVIPGAAVAPAWLVALWPNFAATTGKGGLLSSVARRPLVAAALGAVGGPLAYDGGARLGALGLHASRLGALAVLALVWAAVVPALFALRSRVSPALP